MFHPLCKENDPSSHILWGLSVSSFLTSFRVTLCSADQLKSATCFHFLIRIIPVYNLFSSQIHL